MGRVRVPPAWRLRRQREKVLVSNNCLMLLSTEYRCWKEAHEQETPASESIPKVIRALFAPLAAMLAFVEA